MRRALLAVAIAALCAPATAAADATELVSVDAFGGVGNDSSFAQDSSADGRLVAFTRGITERASLSGTGAQANSLSQLPAVAPGGHFVVFDSFATNLVPGDTPLTPDLFLRDRKAGSTEPVVPGVHLSGPAALSARAREIAFATLSPALVPGDTNGHADVFVRVRR